MPGTGKRILEQLPLQRFLKVAHIHCKTAEKLYHDPADLEFSQIYTI